ncbi:MAG: LemA family protein [Clostridia bacterium]|nr:LemA family protein [Clostridia bacterium]
MYVLILITIILIITTICIYNTMLSKKNKLLKSYASLDVMLKKRYDLVPNVVNTVKAYAKYEQETLEKIISIRSRANECKDSKDLEEVSQNYNMFMDDVSFLAEQYPDLKANTNFLHLQKLLNELEEQISAARRTYNAHVEKFNTYISYIPLNIFASIFKFKPYDFFEINSHERETKIWFNEDEK